MRLASAAAPTAAQAVVLEVQASAGDGGADVSRFSQYPGGPERVWGRGSLVTLENGRDARGMTLQVSRSRAALVVRSHVVSGRPRAMSVEEARGGKRALHVGLLRCAADGAELYLAAHAHEVEARAARERAAAEMAGSGGWGEEASADALAAAVRRDCEEVLARHSAVEDGDFSRPAAYRRLLGELAAVEEAAEAKVRLYLEDSGQFLRDVADLAPRRARRALASLLAEKVAHLGAAGQEGRRQAAAMDLCRVSGLAAESMAEVNELGETPLMEKAAEGAEEAALRALRDAGAALDAADADGHTAAMVAAALGHTGTLRALARLGADVLSANLHGETALLLAAEGGHADAVRALAGLGATVDARTVEGDTALMRAALGGHGETAAALCELGADVNARNRGGYTPLILAAGAGHGRTAAALLALGADRRAARNDGLTAVLAAAAAGHVEAVRVMAAAGEDLGAAARVLAALARNDAAAEFLLPALRRLAEAGADVAEAGPDGRAPADLAASPAFRAAVREICAGSRRASDSDTEGQPSRRGLPVGQQGSMLVVDRAGPA